MVEVQIITVFLLPFLYTLLYVFLQFYTLRQDFVGICNFNFPRVEQKGKCSSKDKGANNTLEIGARPPHRLVNLDRERKNRSTYFLTNFLGNKMITFAIFWAPILLKGY